MASPRIEEGAVCSQCGYDLRGTRSRKCPECGATARRSSGNTGIRRALDHARDAATIMADLRSATIATVLVWGGVACLGAIGGPVWVLVALGSIWRFIAVWRLGRCETCKADLRSTAWTLLRTLAWVEAAVALIGAIGVFLGSAVGISAAGTVILALLPRIVWVALIGANTFLVARVAMRLIRVYDWNAPDPWVGIVMYGSLVAPALMIPGIMASIISLLTPGKVNDGVINALQLGAIAGCAFGLVGIIAPVILLSMASRAGLARAADQDSTRW